MNLLRLRARRYRSLREETITLSRLNLFIGANAAGKSTILDALRFLHEGLQERDFSRPVASRGGIVHLAWKGEDAHKIDLNVEVEQGDTVFDWSVQLVRDRFDFAVHRENVYVRRPGSPPEHLLEANSGVGWWWSGDKKEQVALTQPATACALGNAAPNTAFPARPVADFISRWGFFDPSPFLLRRGWTGFDGTQFDPYGRNLAERLFALRESSPNVFREILEATRSVLGLPRDIELRESRDSEDRVYFVQHEPGLKFSVHQIGASSGTLRILALMTALFGESESNLIGIEEPENYVHPTALAAFAKYLLAAKDRIQALVTTHSPLLLNFIGDPGSVCVVRHFDEQGTTVMREGNAQAVRQALDASGFGLGEFYETKGFGA